MSFQTWLRIRDRDLFENIGGFRLGISDVDDEGDGLDELVPSIITPKTPGAMPTYGDDLPPTKKSRRKHQRFGAKM
jgi:hypothetical protein